MIRLHAPNARRPRAEDVFRWVLTAGFLLMLGANLPGHLSYDSVVQLYEGRNHLHETWAPAVYSAILGIFDGVAPGTGLYVAASGLLLFGALISLARLSPTMTWAAPVLAFLMVLTPDLLIYQAIVWKDVLFANLAAASFILLAHVARDWTGVRPPWLALAGMVLMLALAAQVRQNGLVVTLFAALTMAWIVRGRGARASLAWGLGGLAAVLLASQALGFAAQPPAARPHKVKDVGLRILQQYDIIGAVAHDRTLSLSHIREASPVAERVIRTRAVPLYSPERVDFLNFDPAVGKTLWNLPPKVVSAEWRRLILRRPDAYLAHRWEAFRWVFLTPMIDSCLPIFTGVDPQSDKLADLKIAPVTDDTDRSLHNYATWFFDTPVYSHLSYVIAALAVAGVLLRRRDPADMVMVGLMAAALAFTASFFFISLACDYRYLYFLDIAAMTGLLYLAINPPLAQLGLRRTP